MKVGELRKLLELFPDDAEVIVREWVYDSVGLYDVKGVCLRSPSEPERGVAVEVGAATVTVLAGSPGDPRV